MVKICPSILSCNSNEIFNSIKLVLPEIKIIHLDIMDGIYVPKITFGQDVVKQVANLVKPFGIYVDSHLMIDLNKNHNKNIFDKVASFAEFSDGITIHYESFREENKKDIMHTIYFLKSFDIDVGLAVEPNTSARVLLDYMNNLERILIMTVKSGKGGQGMIEEALNKIPYLRNKGYKGIIQVDGGVKEHNIIKVIDACADEIVVGSALVDNDMLSYDKFMVFKKIIEGRYK